MMSTFIVVHDQIVDFRAESFAKWFQTTAQDTKIDLSDTLSNRMNKLCGEYVKVLSDWDAALCQDVTE